MAVRLFLYYSYPDYFSNLSSSELFSSLFMGIRIDLAIISLFTSVIWLLLLLPFRFTFSPYFRKLLGLIWGIIIGGIVFYNIADTFYFGFVNRHIVNEVAHLGNDIYPFINMAFNLYTYQIIIGFIIFVTIIYIYFKIFSGEIINKSLNKKEWTVIPLIIVISFLGIRGKVSGKSFSISDAFAVSKLSSGNLALSGVYTTYRSAKQEKINHYRVTPSKAIKILQETMSSEKFKFSNKEYPLMRSMVEANKTNYNVVIVVLESLSAKYLDALANNDFGVTPTLDKLATQGQLYTNFYANGQRSQDGITTIYTGITQPVAFESLGSGLELYGLSYLGEIVKDNGYSTLAMQSSNRRSFRVDVVSHIAGFDQYYGAQDIPKTGDEQGEPQFGEWDGNSFRFLFKKLNKIQEPFLSFFFTSTTHAPFFLPHKRYEKYPHSNKNEKGFLNTINYVDTQISHFIENAKKEKWFDNTIFIFTSDHVAARSNLNGAKQTTDNSILDGYHIPLILYAPKILKPLRSNVLSSHSDIIPSIIDILGLETNFSMIGQSIFDNSVNKRFVYVKAGNMIGLGLKNGSVFYNYNNFLGINGDINENEKELLLSIDSAQSYLLKNSKWMKK